MRYTDKRIENYMQRLKKYPGLIEKLRVRCVEVIDELGEPQGSDPIPRAMHALGDEKFLELLNETVPPMAEANLLPSDEDYPVSFNKKDWKIITDI